MHKFFIMVEIMTWLALSVPADPAPEKRGLDEPVGDLSGIYAVTGTRPAPGGSLPYTGTCLIKRHGEGYFVQSASGECATGIASRSGDILSHGWSTEGARGVTVYRITQGKAGPVLTGSWLTWPGNGRKYVEVLRFVSPLPDEE